MAPEKGIHRTPVCIHSLNFEKLEMVRRKEMCWLSDMAIWCHNPTSRLIQYCLVIFQQKISYDRDFKSHNSRSLKKINQVFLFASFFFFLFGDCLAEIETLWKGLVFWILKCKFMLFTVLYERSILRFIIKRW